MNSPVKNVKVKDLLVGDIVTMEYDLRPSTIGAYDYATVIAIHDNQVAFARPFTRLDAKTNPSVPRPYEHIHEINGRVIYFGQEVWTTYINGNSATYTVWDSPLNDAAWYYNGEPYPGDLEDILK